MPCWVAPAVAAEMWGLSLDEVMARVANGSLASKSEAEFLFVDVLPHEPEQVLPPPPTFTILTHEEIEALSSPPAVESHVLPEGMFIIGASAGETIDGFKDEETPTFSAAEWKSVRARVSRTRRAPAKLPVALVA